MTCCYVICRCRPTQRWVSFNGQHKGVLVCLTRPDSTFTVLALKTSKSHKNPVPSNAVDLNDERNESPVRKARDLPNFWILGTRLNCHLVGHLTLYSLSRRRRKKFFFRIKKATLFTIVSNCRVTAIFSAISDHFENTVGAIKGLRSSKEVDIEKYKADLDLKKNLAAIQGPDRPK